MDFRLDKSIQVSNGQITGDVNPTLDINAVGPSDPGASTIKADNWIQFLGKEVRVVWILIMHQWLSEFVMQYWFSMYYSSKDI